MDIREYNPTDSAACRAILGADDWSAPPESYFVAEHDGRVIGCGGYVLGPGDGSARLHALAVDAAFRRMGVGRFLAMYSLREASRKHGIRMMDAEAPAQAREFLERLGFRTASAADDATVVMIKKLEVCA